MGLVIHSRYGAHSVIPTANAIPTAIGVLSHQRAPTDPFFYANVDVENMVVGSRWMLGYTPSGGEFTELASGTAATSAFTIENVPSYASPMLLELRVRKASGSPKYEPLRQYANHNPNGVNMYLAQQLDEIAL